MKYCSVHNQTFSVLLEVSRGFKSAPQVKPWADAQPEMAAVVLCMWQCPHTKRSVLLPSSQVPKKALSHPSASKMSSGSLVCCKYCNANQQRVEKKMLLMESQRFFCKLLLFLCHAQCNMRMGNQYMGRHKLLKESRYQNTSLCPFFASFFQ